MLKDIKQRIYRARRSVGLVPPADNKTVIDAIHELRGDLAKREAKASPLVAGRESDEDVFLRMARSGKLEQLITKHIDTVSALKPVEYAPTVPLLPKTAARDLVSAYVKDRPNERLRLLGVGGGYGGYRYLQGFAERIIMDIAKSGEGDFEVVIADICDPNLDLGQQFDVVFSHDVFEHVEKPWIAAQNCLRLCKVGGLNVHAAPFAWRYHPVPTDYFRFSHDGFRVLFEKAGYDVETVLAGYDISERRVNKGGSQWKKVDDRAPVDALGGFRDNWRAVYGCRRLT
ncbi:class I SAM-dependent methyltransferase [Pelagibacterium sp. 26DY04]|uniref:methyltransferase domain-containing protein n=1 Tax=Pelagibacterium sp. 26DY04 TaxID=2967130 RepID=UPI00281549FB|nr:methyltransferase domain-containing protein [Pelagibacterium sp. 26DY04]WMT88285.1 class I SAM-dependent methyltransferase [Pelagibacterium sp. 26DY04]